nr:MAG: hypothetical protein [Owegonang virus 1]
MSLQIENTDVSNTTDISFALQDFQLPFDPWQFPGLINHQSELLPTSEFLANTEYQQRLDKTPVLSGAIGPTTGAFSKITSYEINLETIQSLLKNSGVLTDAYSLFSCDVMLRLEIVGAATYQGAVAYTVHSSFLKDDFTPSLNMFGSADMHDSSLSRRLFYQNPTIRPLDRTTYVDIPLPIKWPLNMLYTNLKAADNRELFNYPMTTFTMYNLIPLQTQSEIDTVSWSIRPYLVNVQFSTPVANG